MLLAVPELKTVAPCAYDDLIIKARETYTAFDIKFWYEFLQGVIIFALMPVSDYLIRGDYSIIVSVLSFIALFGITSFILDFFYFRILKKALITQLFCNVTVN